jgi:hypothetical protein
MFATFPQATQIRPRPPKMAKTLGASFGHLWNFPAKSMPCRTATAWRRCRQGCWALPTIAMIVLEVRCSRPREQEFAPCSAARHLNDIAG